MWIELSSRLKVSKTIDQANQRLIESEKQYWNGILQRIVSVVQLLGQQFGISWFFRSTLPA
jgi:hypothetical protein